MEATQVQLQLLDEPKDWRLDESTKEIGREGLAAARAAIQEARRRSHQEHRTAA